MRGFIPLQIIIVIAAVAVVSILIAQQVQIAGTLPQTNSSPVNPPISPSTQLPSSQPIVGNPVSPQAFNGSIQNLPSATPYVNTPSTATQGDIQVSVSKGVINSGETIQVTIANKGSGTLSYHVGPGCGLFFENKSGDSWNVQVVSFYEQGEAPCKPVSLNPGESKAESRTINASPPSGMYRVHFKYDNNEAYSAQFEVQ